MLRYDLGEMKSHDGSPLRYEVESKASEYALRISQSLADSAIYKELYDRLPSERLILYFQYTAKQEIYPFVLKGCVLGWYKRNSVPVPRGELSVKIPNCGLFVLLAKHWDMKGVDLKLASPLLFKNVWVDSAKGAAKRISLSIGFLCGNFGHKNVRISDNTKCGIIACHYVEGVNTEKRSDINWFVGSGILPERVLIYIDSISADVEAGRVTTKEVVDEIEKMNFRWVVLQKNIFANRHGHYWHGPRPIRKGLLKNKTPHSEPDKWLVNNGNELLQSVNYWKAFYDEFGVVINYIAEEGNVKNIAQAIAFDVMNGRPGFLVGKQRSEAFLPLYYLLLGFHPKHVHFVWNSRFPNYLAPNHDKVRALIITGHPNNRMSISGSGRAIYVKDLCENGVKFIVTLFDNVHGHDSPFSTAEMADFYRAFLEWALVDKDIGIVVKSKKAEILDSLPSIKSFLDAACGKTGRIKIENRRGRLPSDVASGSDMVVGIGVSSAVIESVIYGCRGVLYDATNLRHHEFYAWGRDKIIFTDLKKMLNAIKRYKEDPNLERGLGDWSGHLHKLDSFADGKGSERMGSYMRFLLEAFDGGAGQDDALRCANKRYSDLWGTDKLIDMKRAYEKA